MSISIILRLLPAALASRQLAGEVEVVATRQRAVVRSADELLTFLATTGDQTTDGDATPARDAIEGRHEPETA